MANTGSELRNNPGVLQKTIWDARKSNKSWLHAKQAPYPLYYSSGPFVSAFLNVKIYKFNFVYLFFFFGFLGLFNPWHVQGLLMALLSGITSDDAWWTIYNSEGGIWVGPNHCINLDKLFSFFLPIFIVLYSTVNDIFMPTAFQNHIHHQNVCFSMKIFFPM